MNGVEFFFRGSSPSVFNRNTAKQEGSDFCMLIQVCRLPRGIGPDLVTNWSASEDDVAASTVGFGIWLASTMDCRESGSFTLARDMASIDLGISLRKRSIAQSCELHEESTILLR